MQFSLRLVLEATVVCAALLATVFVWGKVGFVVVLLLLGLIAAIRRRWIVFAVFAALAFLLAAFFLVAPTTNRARSGVSSANCASNMYQVAVALQVYAQKHGYFPPAYTVDQYGNRLHSWRTLILPELEAGNIYRSIRFDEPWNSPYNSQFHSINLRIFNCPRRPSARPCTHYVAVIGNDTAWPGSAGRALDDFDSSGETILLVEVEDSDIHWMEPRDLEFDKLKMQINPKEGKGISGRHPGKKRGLVSFMSPGANVAFADAHTEFLPVDTPPDKLRAMLLVKKKAD